MDFLFFMLKKILVLDKGGMAPLFVRRLESKLNCSIEVTKEGSYARSFLESNKVSLAIINPYVEQGGIIESYVYFVKNYLKEKNIPVLIFSRAGIERLAERKAFDLDLVLIQDYQEYLKKPASLDKFVECIRGLIEV